MTRVVVAVENVNSHKPEWFPEPVPNETVEIDEELEETDFVVLKVNARDQDVGSDNSRIGLVDVLDGVQSLNKTPFCVDHEMLLLGGYQHRGKKNND